MINSHNTMSPAPSFIQLFLFAESVFCLLQGSQTNVSVADLYASLDDLSETTIHDLAFVENWLYLRFLPVLSYMNEEFVTQLSWINFTCGAFQVMYVKLPETTQKYIHSYLNISP